MLSSESPKQTDREPLQPDVIIFGEVLYDCFPDGHRILGGAPFNVAWGLQGLGQRPLFVSATGGDAEGAIIVERMRRWGLSLDGLQAGKAQATGEVRVTIEDDEPSYEICEGRAWDFIEDSGFTAREWIYHGSLALRSEVSRASFERLVTRSQSKRFFDVNLRPPYDDLVLIKKWMRGVDWLKLNIDELGALVGQNDLDFGGSEPAINALRETYGVANVLLTGGRRGARVVGQSGQGLCSPAPQPEPFVDTVGAGDAFSAHTLDGLLRGRTVEAIVEQASQFAAKVCGLQGATTEVVTFYR